MKVSMAKDMQEKSELRSEKLSWVRTYKAYSPWQVASFNLVFAGTPWGCFKLGNNTIQLIFYKENSGFHVENGL